MMRALVLAAGAARRLRPLSPDLPKPLAPVGNRPVLAWVLEQVDTAPLTEIGVVVPGPARHLYERVMGRFTPAGTPVTWLEEIRPVGSAGALREQRAFLADGPVLVVPADIICPVDLTAMLAHHVTRRRLVTVAAAARERRVWDGDVLLPRPGGLARYLYKPGSEGAGAVLGSTGTWIVETALLAEIPSSGFVDLSSQVLPRLPPVAVGCFDAGEVALRDVGTPATLLTGNLEAARRAGNLPRISPEAVVHTTARLEGPVLVGAGARLRAHVQVKGPAVIGPEAVVEEDCRLERTLVLPGARMEAGQHVTGEIVGCGADATRALLAHAASGWRRP